ncbi:XdhC family protein [Halopseudomonas pachastrellae]|nr:XdhC family protein [Halopseudomonas pachastrellae]
MNDPAGTNLLNILLRGHTAPELRVDQQMPNFAKTYQDAELAAVGSFVLQHFGQTGASLSADDVAARRGNTAIEQAWRAGMSGLEQLLEAVDAAQALGEEAVLATVVKVEGSAYRRPGARMLINALGQTAGTVSGGCLESEVARMLGG